MESNSTGVYPYKERREIEGTLWNFDHQEFTVVETGGPLSIVTDVCKSQQWGPNPLQDDRRRSPIFGPPTT